MIIFFLYIYLYSVAAHMISTSLILIRIKSELHNELVSRGIPLDNHRVKKYLHPFWTVIRESLLPVSNTVYSVIMIIAFIVLCYSFKAREEVCKKVADDCEEKMKEGIKVGKLSISE